MLQQAKVTNFFEFWVKPSLNRPPTELI